MLQVLHLCKSQQYQLSAIQGCSLVTLTFSHTESTPKAPLRGCLSLSSTDVCDGDRLLFLRAPKHIQTSTQKWNMLSAILLCQCTALTLTNTTNTLSD